MPGYPKLPIAPGADPNCKVWHRVGEKETCELVAQKYVITFTRLKELNTQLDAGCTNLWYGYDYCVQ
jgi:hypothetical protein